MTRIKEIIGIFREMDGEDTRFFLTCDGNSGKSYKIGAGPMSGGKGTSDGNGSITASVSRSLNFLKD